MTGTCYAAIVVGGGALRGRCWLWPSWPIAQNLGTLGTGVRRANRTVERRELAPPTGPAPRLPNGKPDFSGVWDHPYVPDMSSSNARNPALQKGRRATALHAGRPREHQELRPGKERRLHRHVHAVRADAVDERAVSDPDHAERQVRRVPLRESTWFHVVPFKDEHSHGSEPDLVRRIDREVGRRHAGHRHDRLQRLHAPRHRAATRTATSCTWCRRSRAPTPGTSPTRSRSTIPSTTRQPWTNERTFTLSQRRAARVLVRGEQPLAVGRPHQDLEVPGSEQPAPQTSRAESLLDRPSLPDLNDRRPTENRRHHRHPRRPPPHLPLRRADQAEVLRHGARRRGVGLPEDAG